MAKDDAKAADAAPPAAEAVDPSKMTDEEKKAYEEGRAASQKLLDMAGGPMAPPLAPGDLFRPDDVKVLCMVPAPPGGRQMPGIPLTLDAIDGHRRVILPPGTYYLPARLVTEYRSKAHPQAEPTVGMHFYLAAHGVKVVDEA